MESRSASRGKRWAGREEQDKLPSTPPSTSLFSQRSDFRGTNTMWKSVLTPDPPPLFSSRLMFSAMMSMLSRSGLVMNTTFSRSPSTLLLTLDVLSNDVHVVKVWSRDEHHILGSHGRKCSSLQGVHFDHLMFLEVLILSNKSEGACKGGIPYKSFGTRKSIKEFKQFKPCHLPEVAHLDSSCVQLCFAHPGTFQRNYVEFRFEVVHTAPTVSCYFSAKGLMAGCRFFSTLLRSVIKLES